MEIEELAARIAGLGAGVTESGAGLRLADPGARALPTDAPGRLGELGRAMHDRLAGALAAREREAAGHGARLGRLGTALGAAASGYRAAEDGAHQRHREVT
jgi:hypothetical protein